MHETTPRAFRAKSLYHTFLRQGHEVVFVTPTQSTTDIKNQHNQETPRSRLNNQARTLISKFLYRIVPDGRNFFRSIKIFGNLNQKNIDLTISIGLPFTVHLMTALAIRSGKLKTKIAVADYGDPYSNNPSTNKPFYSALLEKWTLSVFDKVSVPNINSVPAYAGLLPLDKVVTIAQGHDIDQDLSNNYSDNKVPSFCFAGNLYKKIRNPSTFLEHLTTIDKNFEFHIYTDFKNTETMEILRPFKDKLKNRLILHSQIPRETCIDTMSRMDFLVNFSNKSTTQTPSKIIDYTLSSRPFLNISHDQKAFEEFDNFLDKNYSTFIKPDLSEFDENLISEKFLTLL